MRYGKGGIVGSGGGGIEIDQVYRIATYCSYQISLYWKFSNHPNSQFFGLLSNQPQLAVTIVFSGATNTHAHSLLNLSFWFIGHPQRRTIPYAASNRVYVEKKNSPSDSTPLHRNIFVFKWKRADSVNSLLKSNEFAGSNIDSKGSLNTNPDLKRFWMILHHICKENI